MAATTDAQEVPWCQDAPDGVILRVLVQPKASRARVGPVQGDRLKVAVTAPPVEGAANEAVVKLLAKTFGLRRGAVTLRAGQSGRRKTLLLRGATAAALRRKVSP